MRGTQKPMKKISLDYDVSSLEEEYIHLRRVMYKKFFIVFFLVLSFLTILVCYDDVCLLWIAWNNSSIILR